MSRKQFEEIPIHTASSQPLGQSQPKESDKEALARRVAAIGEIRSGGKVGGRGWHPRSTWHRSRMVSR